MKNISNWMLWKFNISKSVGCSKTQCLEENLNAYSRKKGTKNCDLIFNLKKLEKEQRENQR